MFNNKSDSLHFITANPQWGWSSLKQLYDVIWLHNLFYGECCLMDWWISNLRFMRCAINRLHLLIDLVVWVLFWWLYSHWMRLISDWTCPIDVSLIWNGILGILDGWHSLHCLVTWFNGSAALPPALVSPEAEFYMWWMIGFLECFFSFSF